MIARNKRKKTKTHVWLFYTMHPQQSTSWSLPAHLVQWNFRFVFGSLPGASYFNVVPPNFLIWNNLCDLVY